MGKRDAWEVPDFLRSCAPRRPPHYDAYKTISDTLRGSAFSPPPRHIIDRTTLTDTAKEDPPTQNSP